MKPTTAGVAAFSGLAAIVAADGLPMDSIPVQCIKVCGPIVELTNICNTNVDSRRRALRRRKADEHVPAVGRVQSSRRQHAGCSGGHCKMHKKNAEPDKRQFSVIRQAPTSFPPEVLPPPEETIAAQPTRVFPVILTTSSIPTAANPPPPPTDVDEDDGDDDDEDDDPEDENAALPSSTSSTSSTSSSSPTVAADTKPTPTEALVGADEDDEEWWVPGDAEQECVCMNESFNVARLTALCASCVDQSGDDTNNINIIVSTCGFPKETYSRELDRVADNVRVKATKPTMQMTMGGQNAGAVQQQEAGGSLLRGQIAVLLAGVATCAAVII